MRARAAMRDEARTRQIMGLNEERRRLRMWAPRAPVAPVRILR